MLQNNSRPCIVLQALDAVGVDLVVVAILVLDDALKVVA